MWWLGASILYFLVLQFGNTAPAFHLPLVLECVTAGVSIWLIKHALSAKQIEPALSPMIKFIGGGICVLLALILLRGLSAWLHMSSEPVCSLAPGIVQKLECIFQSESAAIPSPRQLSYNLAAAFAFLGALVLSHKNPDLLKKFLNGGLFVGSLLALLSLLNYFSLTQLQTPQWFFINEFGPACLFIQNPSWIWPWVTPWLGWAVWNVIESKSWGPFRFLYLLAGTVLCFFSLSSSQRGSVLQIIVSLVAVAVILTIRQFRGGQTEKNNLVVKHRIYGKLFTSAGLFLGLFFVVSYFVKPKLINSTLATLGIVTRVGGGESSLSNERLAMWQIAWDRFLESPLWGFGHGSWNFEFGVFAQKVGQTNLIFDTAHNFFVQSLFELGFIHTLIIVSFFAYIVLKSFKNVWNSEATARSAWFSGVIAAYLLILLVQEVDFIRSAYYQHAFFWGWLLGTTNPPTNSNNIDDSSSKKFRLSRFKPFSVELKGFLSFGALGLVSIGILCAISFSLAGYQYEANRKNQFQPKVRWFKNWGTINPVITKYDGRKRILRYRVFKTVATQYETLTSRGWQTFPISNQADAYIDFPAQTFPALPYIIRFNASQNDFGRSTAVLLSWPPEVIEISESGKSRK